MMKKTAVLVLALLMAIGMALSGCASSAAGTTAPANTQAATPAPTAAPTEAPTEASTEAPSPEPAQKYSILLVENGWVNTPLAEGNDPWKPWADAKYNIDLKLQAFATGDMEQKLMTMFASNDQPDLMFFWAQDTCKKFYSQGLLVDDYTPYLPKLPTLSKYITDGAKALCTIDGKLAMLPLAPDKSRWTVQIRKDWAAKLGLNAPTTPDELLNFMVACTTQDPDGNGKADTWGTTSGGNNTDLNDLGNYELMYGQTGYFVGSDGKVTNSIVNGTHKKFLDWAKKVVDGKCIDPDWYTQDWGKLTTKVHGSKVGVISYPTQELFSEEYGVNGATAGDAVADYWQPIPIPKGDPNGGKLSPDPLAGGFYAISAKTASDAGKLDRVLQILDDAQYPNDGYWGFRRGVGVPGVDAKIGSTADGIKFDTKNKDVSFYSKDGNVAAYDYGTWCNFNGTDPTLETSELTPGKVTLAWYSLQQQVVGWEKYTNYGDLLHLDPAVVSDLTTLVNKFDINYILGKETDYDKFITQWLAGGGQKCLDDATAQLTALGMLK